MCFFFPQNHVAFRCSNRLKTPVHSLIFSILNAKKKAKEESGRGTEESEARTENIFSDNGWSTKRRKSTADWECNTYHGYSRGAFITHSALPVTESVNIMDSRLQLMRRRMINLNSGSQAQISGLRRSAIIRAWAFPSHRRIVSARQSKKNEPVPRRSIGEVEHTNEHIAAWIVSEPTTTPRLVGQLMGASQILGEVPEL